MMFDCLSLSLVLFDDVVGVVWLSVRIIDAIEE